MPTQPTGLTKGTRSHRSTAENRLRRLAAMLSFITLLFVSVPSPALGAYVYLDPGHGGRYPGAVYAGTTEASVNLLLALEVRAALAARGHRVGMTRESNATVGPNKRPCWHWDDDGVHYRYCDSGCSHDAPINDLQARVDKANEAGADLFISIHNNAAGSSARGTETYHNWDNDTDMLLSRNLADFVQDGIVRESGQPDRGIYGVGFYVVRWSNMPSILVEVGFLSNPTDRALLLTPSFRRQVATGIAIGVDQFLATDPFQPLHPRIAGTNRYETAVEVANKAFPDGADVAYIASGKAWPDSLAATPLAVQEGGPILLTDPDVLPVATAEALAAFDPDRVYVLGGPGAVTSAVETAVAEAAGLEQDAVERLAGTDRYETADAIARSLDAPLDGTVFVVAGGDFPDALSASARAGAIGAPILMTGPSQLPVVTREYLEERADEIDTVFVLGGPRAVQEEVIAELGQTATAQVTRVSGPNRYETNLQALRSFWPSGGLRPYVAKATDFPDALVAGVLAAQKGQPIMLVGTKYLPAKTREYLMETDPRIRGFRMVGGERAVSTVMEWQFEKASMY